MAAESKIAQMHRLKPNIKNALHQTKLNDPVILPLNTEFPFEAAKTEFISRRARREVWENWKSDFSKGKPFGLDPKGQAQTRSERGIMPRGKVVQL